MSLYSDLVEVLTPYANKIKALYAFSEDAGEDINKLTAYLSTLESCRKNIQYTLNTGFIGGNGLPNGGHNNGEVYTSRIPVSAGDVIDIDINWEAQHSVWVAVAKYTSDSDSAFVSRDSLINGVETDTFAHSYAIPSGITHIIVTYRSYDDAVLSITTAWKALENTIQGTTISGQQLTESSINFDKLSDDFAVQSRNIFRGNWTNKGYSASGEFIVQNSGLVVGVPPEIPVIGGETYTLSWGEIQHSSRTLVYVHQFDANDERITFNYYDIKLREKTLTLEANTTHLGVHIYSTIAPINRNELVPTYFQIEVGSTATEYVPQKVVSNNLIDCYGVVKKAQSSIEDIAVIVYQRRALPSNTVKSIAHRGDDVLAPQCTAPAYIMARKRGFTIAENDLWLSKDNQLVMWHDPSLARLGTNLVDVNGYLVYTDGTDFYWYDSANTTLYTHDGSDYVVSDVDVSGLTQCKGADYSVTTLNLNVLKRIDFGVYKGDKFKGTQILTFAEWVLLCKQLGMEIYVDKKLTYTTELLSEAANTVKRLGMGDKTSWLGLNPGLITTLRTIIDGARCGILQHPTSQNVVYYASCNQGRGFFFNGDAGTATAEATRIGLDAGFDVECWYVDKTSVTEANQLEAMRTLVSYGMTAITLDHYKVEDAFADMLDMY